MPDFPGGVIRHVFSGDVAGKESSGLNQVGVGTGPDTGGSEASGMNQAGIGPGPEAPNKTESSTISQ